MKKTNGLPILASTIFIVWLTACGGGDGGGNASSSTVAPNISYSSSIVANVNTAISANVPNNTGGASVSCSVTPSLPTGLTLGNDCTINGTPAATSSQTSYAVTSTNAGGSSNTTIQITVNAALLSPSISYGSSISTVVNAAITPVSPTNTGGTTTSCSANPNLPAGLSLSSTCTLSGTPSSISSLSSYTITATNTAGTSSASISIAVVASVSVPTLSYLSSVGTAGTVGTAISVTPSTFNSNGASVTACAIKGGTTALPGTLTVAPTTCIISGTPTSTLSATVYTLVATNSAGISADATVTLSASAAVPTLSYASSTGTAGTVGISMSVTPSVLSPNGAPITACAVKGGTTALPGYLSVGASTCAISGTPTSTLSATLYTLVATNSAGISTNATVTLTAGAAVPTLSYASSTGTTVNAWDSLIVTPTTLSANGASITACGIKGGTTALPGYLTVAPTTCVISGQPTSTLSATQFTLVATNSAGISTDATVTIQVNQMHDYITSIISGIGMTSNSISIDSSGNIFYSDGFNYRIRMIPAASGVYFGITMVGGTAYTVVGNGVQGYSGNGGLATSAQISLSQGISTDSNGNLYIADTSNHTVRMVPAVSGTYFGINMTANYIYTIAGTGTAGYSGDGGVPTGAMLHSPMSIFVDSSTNIFIADYGNNRIRMIASSAQTSFGQSMTANKIYLIAGNGTSGYSGDGGAASIAKLTIPGGGLSLLGQDLIFVDGSFRVRLITRASGTISAWAGTASGGFPGDGVTKVNAQFNAPSGLFVTADGVFISDQGNDLVRMIPINSGTYFGIGMTANSVYTIAGVGQNHAFSGDGWLATLANLYAPSGLSVDSSGSVYFMDTNNYRIRKIQP